MKSVLDTSVLVSALVESELFHRECKALVLAEPFGIYSHGLVETFNTMTSGKIRPRPSAADVARVLRHSVRPRASILSLSEEDLLSSFDEAEARGVRGGAVFDYLHLVTARRHGVPRLYTLNLRHFESFWRPGDPEIVHPTAG
jgi:predicted nucleic acid-binding protein